jgi:hypothetical protein
MWWRSFRPALGALTALALAVSAVGPCHCLVSDNACHQEAPEADAHGCCEKPAGVQAAADECCDTSPELLVAATDVRQVTPPSPEASPAGPVFAGERSVSVPAVRALAPPSLDRTTVLLI